VEHDQSALPQFQRFLPTPIVTFPRPCPVPFSFIETFVRIWCMHTRLFAIMQDFCAHTCIRCRSMTAAESLLIGRGVLLTTTRKIHCSHLPVNSFRTHGEQWSKSADTAYGSLTPPFPHVKQGRIVAVWLFVQKRSGSNIPWTHKNKATIF